MSDVNFERDPTKVASFANNLLGPSETEEGLEKWRVEMSPQILDIDCGAVIVVANGQHLIVDAEKTDERTTFRSLITGPGNNGVREVVGFSGRTHNEDDSFSEVFDPNIHKVGTAPKRLGGQMFW